jgi:hypothetical protein
MPVSTTSWGKRVTVIGMSIGFGIAVGVALFLAAMSWYTGRPKQWDTQAIRAQFHRSDSFVNLEDWYYKELKQQAPREARKPSRGDFTSLLGKITLQLSYNLYNSTKSDYTLAPPGTSGLIPMQLLKSNNVLIDGKGLKWSIAEPTDHLWVTDTNTVLIPALQTVRVSFAMEYDINDERSDAIAITDWSDDSVQKKFARALLADVDAFVLMDESHHYRIEMPLANAFR